MDETAFWKIIQQANDTTPKVAETFLQQLCVELKSLDPKEILDFYVHVKSARNRAHRGDLWAAGMLLNQGHGTDDGFSYFRNWLIACGETIYNQALKDADSLATVEVTRDNGNLVAELEGLLPVIADTYEVLTGNDFFTEFDRYGGDSLCIKETDDFDWMDYKDEGYFKSHLPKLWERCGPSLKNQDGPPKDSYISELDVPGLGIVHAGDVVLHQKFGKGIIESIDDRTGVPIARVNFESHGKKWLAAEHARLTLVRE